MNKLRKLFSSDRLLYLAGVVAIEFIIVNVIFSIAASDSIDWSFIFISLVEIIEVLFVIITYFKHDKNVMKPLMGGGLTVALIIEANRFFPLLNTYISERSSSSLILMAIEAIILILFIYVVINHFVINSDHHSSPKKVYKNQILILVAIVLFLLQTVLYVVLHSGTRTSYIIQSVLAYLANIPLLIVIICIESKLDVFRLKREKEAKKVEKGIKAPAKNGNAKAKKTTKTK